MGGSQMRCVFALFVASMVGLSTANYGVGGHKMHYLPSKLPGNQQLYVLQHQAVPVINLVMGYSPSVTYPVAGNMPTAAAHNDGMKPVFGRSGSVSTKDTCQESQEFAKTTLQANLDVLDTITKANVDENIMQKIFGKFQSRKAQSRPFQSRFGESYDCSYSAMRSCGTSGYTAISTCIRNGDPIGTIDELFDCLEESLGLQKVGNCLACTCIILGTVSNHKIRC